MYYSNYISGISNESLIELFPELSKLSSVIDEFLSSDDVYLHAYDNKNRHSYLIEKSGSYATVDNPNIDDSLQLVVVTPRSKKFKTRWFTHNHTYEDLYLLQSCDMFNHDHDEPNDTNDSEEVIFDYIDVDPQ
jgi:hypothetical protein